ncbi:hypothetical protein [Paludifilum halophilum]|uniref:Uncharacterized protein n=1 Tax=Paludifilum halophilum TaxID=1642702 RepID=A0A235B1V3_9BACL|nr:hypothetical protein [Paludifilum halophilum]OYD06222.1 hypothetical protein CHM34_17330 [Paludifilum halophilum]
MNNNGKRIMIYQVKSLLNEESECILQKMVYEDLMNIRMATTSSWDKDEDSDHNMGFLVVFDFRDTSISISNDFVRKVEGIAFPQLKVENLRDYNG